jgi:hypothetical protein
LSLALPSDLEIHAKVSLNQILRTLRKSDAPQSLDTAQSVDFLVVRSDATIVVAIDLSRPGTQGEEETAAWSRKESLLAQARIPAIRLEPDMGPEAIRKRLSKWIETFAPESRAADLAL